MHSSPLHQSIFFSLVYKSVEIWVIYGAETEKKTSKSHLGDNGDHQMSTENFISNLSFYFDSLIPPK